MDSSLLCYRALRWTGTLWAHLSREGDNGNLLSDGCASTLHTTPLLQVPHTNLTEVKQTTDLAKPGVPRAKSEVSLIRRCSVWRADRTGRYAQKESQHQDQGHDEGIMRTLC